MIYPFSLFASVSLGELTPQMYATEAQANAFSGIFYIEQDGSTRFQVGFLIPIVFKLKDSNGNSITDAAVTFTHSHRTAN